MRKVFGVLLLFFLMSFPVKADMVDYYCPKTSHNLSETKSSMLAKFSGANFVTKQLIEKLITKVLKEELNTTFDVQLKPFDNNNLLNGKFQSLSVFGQNANKKGIFISTISAQTLCGFNHIKYENGELYFLENMVAKYSARINENDLKQILNSNEYVSSLKNAKILVKNSVLAEIVDVDVAIKNNKICFKNKIMVPFVFGAEPLEFEFSSGLKVEKDRLIFSSVETSNSFLSMVIQNLGLLFENINPFVYKVQTKEKYDIILKVENVKIENNEIFTDGTIVILKNYTK